MTLIPLENRDCMEVAMTSYLLNWEYLFVSLMLMLTSSPALSTQGRVDQISDKVSLLMEGIVNQASVLRQKEDNAPKTDRVYGFLFYFIIFFFILVLSGETSLQMKHTVLIIKNNFQTVTQTV